MSALKECEICGSTKRVYFNRYSKKEGLKILLCEKCKDKFDRENIQERLTDVKQACDFRDWKSADMSEAFWIHLGEYQKRPNRYSLNIMLRALYWAHHADHGLGNSFENALKWCGIDWVKEKKRTDLPEK